MGSPQVFHADASDGPIKARRSDASTADTLADSLCDEQLDTISEELGSAMQFSSLTDDSTVMEAVEDGHARNAAKNLREAVVEAVTVLQGFSRRTPGTATPRTSQGAQAARQGDICRTHDTPVHGLPGAASGTVPCRRAFSEEISQSTRRPSFGRREGPQRRISRVGKARPQSRCTTPIRERVESDGGDGDVEDLHSKVETRPSRRGRRSLVPEQCSVPAAHPQACNDSYAAGIESSSKNLICRSKSVPPVRLESIENFLGFTVGACPF